MSAVGMAYFSLWLQLALQLFFSRSLSWQIVGVLIAKYQKGGHGHAYRECSSSCCAETPPNPNFVRGLPHNLEKLETRLPLFSAELHIDAVFQKAP